MIGYNYLLNIKYKNFMLIIIVLAISITIFILSCLLFTYDRYTIYGIWNDNSIIIDVPINNSDAVVKGMFIKIDDKDYSYNIKSISKLQEYNNLNYQTYQINIPKSFKDNQVLNITFYYNRQRIIKKIIKNIF